LKAELLDNPYRPDNFRGIMAELQSVYPCLGITCEDIGAFGTAVPECRETSLELPIAGYIPSSDVTPYSRIDLDIHQMDILTMVKTYSMAMLIYEFGKNSYLTKDDEYISLQSLATSPNRRDVLPWFTVYNNYFKDATYADTIITDTLQGDGKWGEKSADQRSAYITKSAQYSIMSFAVLTCLQMAFDSCLDEDFERGLEMWDRAAAYLIGSLEGHRDGGGDTQDGQLIWNLANSMCTHFGTCNSNGVSIINADIEDLLYAGKGELNSGDCVNFKRSKHRMEHTMFVPIMQGVLRYAIKNEIHSDTSLKADLAIGEALAISLLPIVAHYDEEAAQRIQDSMVWQHGVKPSRRGAAYVGDALFQVMDDFGLKCEYVGSFGKVDVCAGNGDLSSGTIVVKPSLFNKLLSLAAATLIFICGTMQL